MSKTMIPVMFELSVEDIALMHKRAGISKKSQFYNINLLMRDIMANVVTVFDNAPDKFNTTREAYDYLSRANIRVDYSTKVANILISAIQKEEN